MYVGFTLAHLGLAAATRNGWMLATCPVSAALVHRWVPREERLLHELFGTEYDAYRATVPRYLRVRRRRADFEAVQTDPAPLSATASPE